MVEESILINEKDYIILKKAIAKTLYNKKMDQIKISEILNLSQPMVSNYCSKNNNIPRNIQTYADEISRKIIDGSKTSFNISVLYKNKSNDFLISHPVAA